MIIGLIIFLSFFICIEIDLERTRPKWMKKTLFIKFAEKLKAMF